MRYLRLAQHNMAPAHLWTNLGYEAMSFKYLEMFLPAQHSGLWL